MKAKTLEGQILWFADRIAYINHDIEDAMRGGIIYPTDIPLYLQQELGYTESQRINTLVTDVIEHSAGTKTASSRATEIGGYMNDLRDFLFQSVYHNPMAKGEEGKAQEMIRSLFAYYQRHPDDLPSDFQDIRARGRGRSGGVRLYRRHDRLLRGGEVRGAVHPTGMDSEVIPETKTMWKGGTLWQFHRRF